MGYSLPPLRGSNRHPPCTSYESRPRHNRQKAGRPPGGPSLPAVLQPEDEFKAGPRFVHGADLLRRACGLSGFWRLRVVERERRRRLRVHRTACRRTASSECKEPQTRQSESRVCVRFRAGRAPGPAACFSALSGLVVIAPGGGVRGDRPFPMLQSVLLCNPGHELSGPMPNPGSSLRAALHQSKR